MSHPLRPFYFTVVFWGAVYRGYFTDLLLASLLSPNNIPALNRDRHSKFLIVTTRPDWEALQDQPMFRLLQQYVDPVWFEMSFPGPHEPKMLVMSKGHRIVSSRAFQDQAYGVFVTPDLILSDGSVAAMQRLAEEGKKVVLCVAIRFRYETLLPQMEQAGYVKAGQLLSITGRDLMRLALRNLHSETLRYEFDAPHFADCPISVYWWVPDGDGMIIHSFSWAPLVVDYGSLARHDTETFENWTLDGDYIYRNFPDPGDMYVVTDSDELSLVSFTKEAELHFDLIPEPKKSHGILSEAYKVLLIRALKNSAVMDPLKRSIFPLPVLLHSAGISGEWHRKLCETTKLIGQACRMPGLRESFEAELVDQLNSSHFARHVVRQLKTTSSQEKARRLLLRYFVFWKWVIRPWRVAYGWWQQISRFIRLLGVPFAKLFWVWRYRRFVWWRLKEKLGWVEVKHFNWRDGGWAAPGVSLVCPWFTLRWVWRYRRFVWWRLKEKLGWVEVKHFNWHDGGWTAPGVSLVCPWFTLRWAWRQRAWLWAYRHFVWRRLKEKWGLVPGRSQWDDPDGQPRVHRQTAAKTESVLSHSDHTPDR